MVKKYTNEGESLTIEEALAEAKKICWRTGYNANNKYDPLHFWQISDDLRDVEIMVDKLGGEKKVKRYFKENLCSNGWQSKNLGDNPISLGRLVDKLNSAGTTPLSALNTDIRVRRIPNKILLGYQNVFYYIWQIKELLNIKPDPKSETGGSDFRYPNFGYVYSEGENWGKLLMDHF